MHNYLFLVSITILLEYDFLGSELVIIDVNYSKCTVSTFSPGKSFAPVSCNYCMVFSTSYIDDVYSGELLYQDWRAFGLDVSVSDTQLTAAVATLSIDMICIGNKCGVLSTTSN